LRFSLWTWFAGCVALMGVIGMFVGVSTDKEHIAGTGAFTWMAGAFVYLIGITRDERDINKKE